MKHYEIKEILTLSGHNGMLLLQLQPYDTKQEQIIIEINNDDLFNWLPDIVEKSLNLRKKETTETATKIKQIVF